MGHYKVNSKEIFFILKEQLKYGHLCQLKRYKDLNEKTFDLLINEAISFARGVMDPLNEIGEQQGVHFENGQVSCPEEFRDAFRQFGEDGWLAISRDPEYGGQGFPLMFRSVVNEFINGSCIAVAAMGGLTHGAAHLIETFGTDELKRLYVPKMYGGVWSGTMCLTEPNAGSNLAVLETTAVRHNNHFRIKGGKQFITWGEQDFSENIIHLVLARIEDAPKGIQGISLFVVPKIRPNPDGSLGELNDVVCTGIEKKMGLHAAATCSLTFGGKDDCIGYLCGEENNGVGQMFQMMNSSRVNTGVTGMTLASTAYLNALEYTKTRLQGTDISGETKEQVTIINHPDIHRMLLWMKANVEGMRSMIYMAAFWNDLAYDLPEGEKKTKYQNLFDFITPVLKAFCSDTGFRVCETAIQCLGGYGFCNDYPLEQYLRDSKILSLFEGTNGIQSMDLMGRKMSIRDGACFKAFQKEIDLFSETYRDHDVLGDHIRTFDQVAKKLWEASRFMLECYQSDRRWWGFKTYPALMAYGEVIVAWRLLDMALISVESSKKKGKKYDFYRGKVTQATYYVNTVLPQSLAAIESILNPTKEIVQMPENAF